jgi:ParB-like chromosome segregation protein Spo0J
MVWVKIAELIMDSNYYPREKIDPIVVWRYKMAMEAGAQFPPILVGKNGGKYIVIDGWHRVEAAKLLGKDTIEAFITDKPESEWFVEAVKANAAHGKRLTTYELIKAALKLEQQGFSRENISEIVRIPPEKLERLINRRVVRDELNKPVVLKAPLKHLAKKEETIPKEVEVVQEKLGSISQLSILDQLLYLLRNQLIDLHSEAIRERLREIRELLEQLPL